jgi:hypothetical protein
MEINLRTKVHSDNAFEDADQRFQRTDARNHHQKVVIKGVNGVLRTLTPDS